MTGAVTDVDTCTTMIESVTDGGMDADTKHKLIKGKEAVTKVPEAVPITALDQEKSTMHEPIKNKNTETHIMPEPIINKNIETDIMPKPIVNKNAETDIMPEPATDVDTNTDIMSKPVTNGVTATEEKFSSNPGCVTGMEPLSQMWTPQILP